VSAARTTLRASIALLAAALPGLAASSGESLQGCAAIPADAQRLACFDRLAAQSAAGKLPVAAAVPAAPATAVQPPAFGLYKSEHPAAVEQAISAKITAFGRRADGKPTIALEGNGLWELEDSDPLMAVGDVVTIRRSALGSFMLETPTHRTHHVRRLS
jgi:hypothetical protein